MNTYIIQFNDQDALLRIAFGEQLASNDVIVCDVEFRLIELKASGELAGGKLIRVNGPASLPVAMVLSHHLVHLYQNVAVYDPKLGKYVIISNHGGAFSIGDLID
jgi:CRISPR-associated protein Csx3